MGPHATSTGRASMNYCSEVDKLTRLINYSFFFFLRQIDDCTCLKFAIKLATWLYDRKSRKNKYEWKGKMDAKMCSLDCYFKANKMSVDMNLETRRNNMNKLYIIRKMTL